MNIPRSVSYRLRAFLSPSSETHETQKWPLTWWKACVLVSRVSSRPFAARRSCARALPLLNLKKKRDCSQSILACSRRSDSGERCKVKRSAKNKSEGGGEVREGTPVRFVLNRLFRPRRPHQLLVVFTCQSRLVLQPHTFIIDIIFLANKSKFLRSKINVILWIQKT